MEKTRKTTMGHIDYKKTDQDVYNWSKAIDRKSRKLLIGKVESAKMRIQMEHNNRDS